MELLRAETKAKYLVNELKQYCDRIEVAGNIRRRKPSIDNIDILLSPRNVMLFELMSRIVEMGSEDGMRVSSKKTILLKDEFDEIKVNLWFTSINRWSVMLLIKTGGNKTIKQLEKLCNNKKWRLSINDGIIFDENNKKIPIEKEEDVFELLKIPFIESSWRD